MSDYLQSRVNAELSKSFVEQAPSEIRKKERELKVVKAKNALKKFARRFTGKDRVTNREVLRNSSRATVVVNQPVYNEDRSRFFKETWDQEERRLFFR